MESVIFFTDGVITARPYQAEDLPEVYAAVCESQNEPFFWSVDLKGLSQPDVQTYIESQPKIWNEDIAYNFVILDSSSNGIQGGCGLTHINRRHRTCSLYYWIRNGSTGKGYATRAVILMARFAFDSLGMRRMEIMIEPENLAGLRVVEKAGAISEGYLRSRFFHHGDSKDVVLFSLLPEDLSA